MGKSAGYWRPVVILAVLGCLGLALSCLVVPGIADGTIPPIGVVVWFVLAIPYLLPYSRSGACPLCRRSTAVAVPWNSRSDGVATE